MRISILSFLLLGLTGITPVSGADPLPTSDTPIAVEQALAGNKRLVVWELPGNGGMEAQVLDALAHEPLSPRLALGPRGEADEPPISGIQTRPAVAGIGSDDGSAVFFIAWHAEVHVGGANRGTEVVGQRVVVNVDGVTQLDPLVRVSRVDDDTNATAASEPRSAPVVAANIQEQEFAVVWTHWFEGKALEGEPAFTHDHLFIFGQEISASGVLAGDAAHALDVQHAPPAGGLPQRADDNVIFLALAPQLTGNGYLLAWSDPAQEGEDLEQLFTKEILPDLTDTVGAHRVGIGDGELTSEGTGRIALAPLPDASGYLLAYEDSRGKGSLKGYVLDAAGVATHADGIPLLDHVETTDHAFLTPRLVTSPVRQRLLLFAAVGDRSVETHDAPMRDGRLVMRTLDLESLAFERSRSDFKTVLDAYPETDIYFANAAHAAGALPDDAGAAVFAVTAERELAVIEHRFPADPPPVEPPPSNPPPANPPATPPRKKGGGALFLMLPLLALARRRVHASRITPVVVLAALGTTASAAPPDVELLHSNADGKSCYRAVMYREVTEIRLGASWDEDVFPAHAAIEIPDVPAGWKVEKIVETKRRAQIVRLVPAPFDVTTGFSIGKVCLSFNAPPANLEKIPYTYELAATGSRINARARPDDGISEDELRAMVKRGERLKHSVDPLAKPKQVEESVKTMKRLKDLFD